MGPCVQLFGGELRSVVHGNRTRAPPLAFQLVQDAKTFPAFKEKPAVRAMHSRLVPVKRRRRYVEFSGTVTMFPGASTGLPVFMLCWAKYWTKPSPSPNGV